MFTLWHWKPFRPRIRLKPISVMLSTVKLPYPGKNHTVKYILSIGGFPIEIKTTMRYHIIWSNHDFTLWNYDTTNYMISYFSFNFYRKSIFYLKWKIVIFEKEFNFFFKIFFNLMSISRPYNLGGHLWFTLTSKRSEEKGV